MTLAVLLLLLQLKVPDAAQFVGQPQDTPLAGAQLTRRTNEVSALLRCPVCQGMAVADSPAEMAVNMKAQVRELLRSRGRLSYRALKRRFELDNEFLEDIKEELIKAEHVAVDESTLEVIH